jgi:hypothetical protein
MTKNVTLATLNIQLVDSDPAIWRRVRVPLDIELDELHFVIQVSMGWTGSHIHAFRFGKTQYGSMFDPDSDGPAEEGVALKQALNGARSFDYLYDFGDDWAHHITVESIDKMREEWNFPVCLDGANACPPEDVGAIPGYMNFCKTLADPQAEGHEEALLWAGGAFDPLSFDINRVNRELHGLCFSPEDQLPDFEDFIGDDD